MQLLSQGAEAIIYRDGQTIIKERPKKTYRLPIIDAMLRRSRHRREVKVLKELRVGDIPVPRLISENEKNANITMEFLEGPKVRDALTHENQKAIGAQIGKLLAQMHNKDIIHGDLTTSNMILCGKEVHLIDFGLSFFSEKVEDKAVDLHLLRCALESKHPSIFLETFTSVCDAYYATVKQAQPIQKRFTIVESRGRNKQQH